MQGALCLDWLNCRELHHSNSLDAPHCAVLLIPCIRQEVNSTVSVSCDLKQDALVLTWAGPASAARSVWLWIAGGL